MAASATSVSCLVRGGLAALPEPARPAPDAGPATTAGLTPMASASAAAVTRQRCESSNPVIRAIPILLLVP
jgi:hypothetical protein